MTRSKCNKNSQTRIQQDRFASVQGQLKEKSVNFPHPLVGWNNGPKTCAVWVKLTILKPPSPLQEGGDSTVMDGEFFVETDHNHNIYPEYSSTLFQIMHMGNIQRLVCRCLAKATSELWAQVVVRIAKLILKVI